MDPDCIADIPYASVSLLQQKFRFLHPLLHQVFFKSHMERIFKHPSEINRIQINLCSHRHDGQIFIPKMLFNIVSPSFMYSLKYLASSFSADSSRTPTASHRIL